MLTDKTIVLGITGSIAAYKAADLASKLIRAGARVEVVMTEAATRFITPLTMRNIVGRPVVTDMFAEVSEYNIEHVALAETADVVVIARLQLISSPSWRSALLMICLPVLCWRLKRQ